MPEYNEYERYQQASKISNPEGTYIKKEEQLININEAVPLKQEIYNIDPNMVNIQSPPTAPVASDVILTNAVDPSAPQNTIYRKQEIYQDKYQDPSIQNKPSSLRTEHIVSILWLVFIAIYWTITVLAPSIMDKDLTHRYFYLWIAAAIAMLCVAYTIKEGKYPSGNTKQNLHKLNGSGRYSAFFLVFCICVDYFLLTYALINYQNQNRHKTMMISRVALHSVSLFWITLFFYKRFVEYNGSIAHISFFSEWVDIVISWIVIYLLNSSIDATDVDEQNNLHCFSELICIAYYVFIILKMSGWLFPMFLLDRWGTMPKATQVSIHLVVLDVFTDLPIVVLLLQQEAYRFHGILFFDVFYKILLVIRAVAYHLVYFLWISRSKHYNNNHYPNDNVVREENVVVQQTVQQNPNVYV